MRLVLYEPALHQQNRSCSLIIIISSSSMCTTASAKSLAWISITIHIRRLSQGSDIDILAERIRGILQWEYYIQERSVSSLLCSTWPLTRRFFILREEGTRKLQARAIGARRRKKNFIRRKIGVPAAVALSAPAFTSINPPFYGYVCACVCAHVFEGKCAVGGLRGLPAARAH